MSEHEISITAHADGECAADCPLAAAPRSASLGERAIDRRAFISQATLAAAALALAACGADAATAPATVNGTIVVSDYASLATPGGIALVTVQGAQLAIVRTGSSDFVALSRVCPHQGATVDAETTGFVCPRHGARFDIRGTWTGGQPTSNLRSYPTSYDPSSGILTIG